MNIARTFKIIVTFLLLSLAFATTAVASEQFIPTGTGSDVNRPLFNEEQFGWIRMVNETVNKSTESCEGRATWKQQWLQEEFGLPKSAILKATVRTKGGKKIKVVIVRTTYGDLMLDCYKNTMWVFSRSTHTILTMQNPRNQATKWLNIQKLRGTLTEEEMDTEPVVGHAFRLEFIPRKPSSR